MKRQISALSVAAAVATAAVATPMPVASATLKSSGDDYYCTGYDSCWPIAFYHEVYSDESMTELIGSGHDTCNGGPHVTSPWLPAGYTVKTRMYVCSGMGPYLPPDW